MRFASTARTLPLDSLEMCKVADGETEGLLAAHLETTMGKMPAQMVTRGTAMKNGVAMAPTM